MSTYKVYDGDAKLLGTITTRGRVTDTSEGISGVNALQHLIQVFPNGFYVWRDEPKGIFKHFYKRRRK